MQQSATCSTYQLLITATIMRKMKTRHHYENNQAAVLHFSCGFGTVAQCQDLRNWQ